MPTPKQIDKADLGALADGLEPALRTFLASRPKFRDAVRLLGEALIELADEAAADGSKPGASPAPALSSPAPEAPPKPDRETRPAPAAVPALPAIHGPVVVSAPAPPAAPPPSEEALESLKRNLSGAVSPRVRDPLPPPAAVAKAASPAAPAAPTVPEFGRVAERLALKAEACRWAIERARLRESGRSFDEIKPGLDDLLARAQPLQPVYLWMVNRDTDFIPEKDWQRLAPIYDTLADACRLADAFPAPARDDLALLRIIARLQSSLKRGMNEAWFTGYDSEQEVLFDWCREETRRRQVFLPWLSLDGLEAPEAVGELRTELEELRTRLESRRGAERQRAQGLKKAKYHAGQLASADNGEREYHWQKIVDSLSAALDEGGLPPSDVQIREILLPIAEEIPEALELPRSVELALREVDRFVAQREEQESGEPAAPAREPSAEIRRARELLRGKRVILIGGESRPRARELLERDLQLGELVWIGSREHESIEIFRSEIIRPETDLVLLAIRWASHSFEGVKAFCDEAQKPFVRLPGGYNSSQVAHQVLKQVSEQLQQRTATA